MIKSQLCLIRCACITSRQRTKTLGWGLSESRFSADKETYLLWINCHNCRHILFSGRSVWLKIVCARGRSFVIPQQLSFLGLSAPPIPTQCYRERKKKHVQPCLQNWENTLTIRVPGATKLKTGLRLPVGKQTRHKKAHSSLTLDWCRNFPPET